MSLELRAAARRALESMPQAGSGQVRRIVVEVQAEGRSELVTLSLRDGELLCTASDGSADGPHVVTALRLLALEREPELSASGPVAELAPPPLADASVHPLADALDGLVTAIVRIGAGEAFGAPAVEDAFARIVAGSRTPSRSLSRWIGRVRAALSDAAIDRLARLLVGASRLAEALRSPSPSHDEARRIAAWLGGSGSSPVGVLSECILIEVGREWVGGVDRSALERRYLIDPGSGEIYREERARGTRPGSLGPCPRQISVGLAEVIDGPSPREIRLLQYAVTTAIPSQQWEAVAGSASRSFSALAASFRASLVEFPALAEPFCVAAPASWERPGGLVPVDIEGDALPIATADEPGFTAALEALTASAEPRWVAGRLIDHAGGLMLRPFSLGLSGPDGPIFYRLR
ncbi:MAG: hypothetical protein OEY14_08205 [Myxococcales bacterium]|nr:hypothetical protein [Myxococcales bacterium]